MVSFGKPIYSLGNVYILKIVLIQKLFIIAPLPNNNLVGYFAIKP